VVVVWETQGPTPARRVSWIPGAEGAPRDWGWRCEWVVEWPDGGAILIAMVLNLLSQMPWACCEGVDEEVVVFFWRF